MGLRRSTRQVVRAGVGTRPPVFMTCVTAWFRVGVDALHLQGKVVEVKVSAAARRLVATRSTFMCASSWEVMSWG